MGHEGVAAREAVTLAMAQKRLDLQPGSRALTAQDIGAFSARYGQEAAVKALKAFTRKGRSDAFRYTQGASFEEVEVFLSQFVPGQGIGDDKRLAFASTQQVISTQKAEAEFSKQEREARSAEALAVKRSTQRARATQASGGRSQTIATSPQGLTGTPSRGQPSAGINQGLFEPAHLARRRLVSNRFFSGGQS